METGHYDEFPEAGHQSSQQWPAGSAGEGLTLFTCRGPADVGYRVTATGSNVLLRLSTGTSDKHTTVRVRPPARFVAHGNVVVWAEVESGDAPAEARVMVGKVTAGEIPDVAGVETAESPNSVVLQASAVALRAITDCDVTVAGVSTSLVAGQAIELRGPASLDDGVPRSEEVSGSRRIQPGICVAITVGAGEPFATTRYA